MPQYKQTVYVCDNPKCDNEQHEYPNKPVLGVLFSYTYHHDGGDYDERNKYASYTYHHGGGGHGERNMYACSPDCMGAIVTSFSERVR